MARRRALTWLGRLALVLAGLALGLVAVELVARTRVGTPNAWMLVNTPNWYDTSIFQADRELMQVLAPGATGHFSTPEFDTTVQISSAGTRGPELPPKAAGELRVLTVGDSFTLGVQVELDDSFQARLGPLLAARLGRPVQVINAGVDGYGTAQAARYARRLAPQVQPDLLLVTFFLGNDLADNRGFRPGTYPDRFETLPPLLTPADKRWGWSAIYLHWSAWQKSKRLEGDPMMHHHRAQVSLFSRQANLAPELPATRTAVQELQQVAADLGVPVALAVAPPAYALRAEDTARALAMVGHTGEPDPDGPARALLGALPPDLPVLDLAPALRAGEAQGRTYLIFDGHWSPHGHRVVAEALDPFLSAVLAAP